MLVWVRLLDVCRIQPIEKISQVIGVLERKADLSATVNFRGQVCPCVIDRPSGCTYLICYVVTCAHSSNVTEETCREKTKDGAFGWRKKIEVFSFSSFTASYATPSDIGIHRETATV